jgi:hypothetical protein
MPHLGPDTTASTSRKRSREDAEEASDYETKEEPAVLNDDADDEGSADKKSAKLAASEAAKNKACREKARRERINGRYVHLEACMQHGLGLATTCLQLQRVGQAGGPWEGAQDGQVLHLVGRHQAHPAAARREQSAPATEQVPGGVAQRLYLPLSNAAHTCCCCALQERVAQYERGRGQQLFQLASMQQQPSAAMAPPLQQGAANLPTQVVTGVCPQPSPSASTMLMYHCCQKPNVMSMFITVEIVQQASPPALQLQLQHRPRVTVLLCRCPVRAVNLLRCSHVRSSGQLLHACGSTCRLRDGARDERPSSSSCCCNTHVHGQAHEYVRSPAASILAASRDAR